MRLLGSALAGMAVAIALFLLMSGLISGDSAVKRESDTLLNLDFIRLNLDEVENIRRRVPPPEPLDAPELQVPPRLLVAPREHDSESVPRLETAAFRTDQLSFTIGTGLGRFTGDLKPGSFDEDGDLYPVLRVSPIYPSEARLRRVDGWVDLEYTVLPDGSVADPIVVDASAVRTIASRDTLRVPQDVFNEAALQAIVRWRFKPRVINGIAVPVRVSQRINFDLLE